MKLSPNSTRAWILLTLANIHGVLGLMLTPWGKVVPVSCSWDHSSSAELQSLCEKVITSVSLRR
jgi:hypothetical protein